MTWQENLERAVTRSAANRIPQEVPDAAARFGAARRMYSRSWIRRADKGVLASRGGVLLWLLLIQRSTTKCHFDGEVVIWRTVSYAQTVYAVGGIIFGFVLSRATRRPIARCHDASKSWPVTRSEDGKCAFACGRINRRRQNQRGWCARPIGGECS